MCVIGSMRLLISCKTPGSTGDALMVRVSSRYSFVGIVPTERKAVMASEFKQIGDALASEIRSLRASLAVENEKAKMAENNGHENAWDVVDSLLDRIADLEGQLVEHMDSAFDC